MKLIGQTLCAQKDHRQAIVVIKHLLQLAWVTRSHAYEMKAYELLGQQYFYLKEIEKASYYIERFKRGLFEVPESKIRELAIQQHS